MKQALHIKNLTKKYKDFTLDHISLDLPYGMILGLIGENGVLAEIIFRNRICV